MADPGARPQVVITQLDSRDEQAVSEFYQCVLQPHFPASGVLLLS